MSTDDLKNDSQHDPAEGTSQPEPRDRNKESVDTLHEHDTDMNEPIENEETLEGNIRALMTGASSPPAMRPEAKERIFEKLEASFVANDAAEEDEQPDISKPDISKPENSSPENSSTEDTSGGPVRSMRAPESKLNTNSSRTGKTEDGDMTGQMSWRGYITLAAVGLVGLALFFLLGGNEDPATEEGDKEEVAQLEDETGEDVSGVHENADAGVEVVALPDGSRIKLAPGAAIDITASRSVTITKGQVAIDVAKTENRDPFLVRSRHGQIQVLGTRFLVDVNDQQTLTTVLRGTVRVENEHGNATLHQGEEAALTESEPPTRRAAPRVSHKASWAQNVDTLEDDAPARSGNLLARDPDPRRQDQEFPLEMRNLTLDVHVENQVARVTVDQTFFNQTNRQLEGVYSFPLPGDAAVSRLAMYVNGNLMEGGIIERDRGRNVYEGIVYRRRDPALLEWMQGNQFKVRIFPLFARHEKRILLSYTQTLEKLYESYRLVVPIPEVDQPVNSANAAIRLVGKAGVDVASSTHDISTKDDGDDLLVTWKDEEVRLGDDLILTVHEGRTQDKAPAVTHTEDDDQLLLARAQPSLDSAVQAYQPRRWVVLYDTSGSRTPSLLRAQAYVLRQFLNHIDEADEISLVAFDTDVRPMEGGFSQLSALDPAEVDRFLDAESQGLGLTDMQSALTHARDSLAEAGQNGNEMSPHVLYLGDGIAVESDDALAGLTDTLSGQATFVGVGIGDTKDMRLLDQLASATGGLSVSMNPGEDLAWKAFDTVATLNTPRVLGLEAVLVNEAGEPVDADQYASRDRLADGEELTLLARLGEDKPAAVQLRGQLAGKPWSQTLPLDIAPASAESDAHYLPRTWARARIEALLGDAETNAGEISELGMKHFLITPYTSLLVLETDKMYAEYDVNRGSENTWARYPAPDEIEVVSEPVKNGFYGAMDPDTIIFRTPVQIIGGGGNNYRGSGGLGLSGAGRGGGGTFATGFDASGFGVADTPSPDLNLALVPMEPVLVDEVAVREQATVADNESDFRPPSRPQSSSVVVSGKRLRRSDRSLNDWTVGSNADGKAGKFKAEGKKLEEGRAQQSRFNSGLTASRRGPAAGFIDPYWQSNLYPQAFFSSDQRLNDLTEFVPGIFGSNLDAAANELLDHMPTRRGTISNEASARLQAVREQLVGQQFLRESHGSATTLTLTDRGFRLVRTTPMDLQEVIEFDGDVLQHRYPELGLILERKISNLAPALLPLYAPFLPAEDDALTTWYDVSLDDDVIVLEPIGGKKDDTIRYRLDDNRLTALVYPGQDDSAVVEMKWSTDGVSVSDRGSDPELWKLATGADSSDESVESRKPTSALTLLEMPLRAPTYWSERLKEAEEGSEEWRHLMIQQAAAYVALQRSYNAAQNARELLEAKMPLRRGDLAVLSAGVLSLTQNDASRLASATEDPGNLDEWLRAASKRRNNYSRGHFANLAKEDGLVGTLAHYRDSVENAERYDASKSDIVSAIQFIEQRGVPSLSWVLAYYIGNNWYRYREEKLAQKAWQTFLDSNPPARWEMLGQNQLIRMAYNQGDYELATLRLTDLLDKAEETGTFPPPDNTWQYAFQYSTAGLAGWRTFLGRWRQVALKTQSASGLLNLVAMSANGNDIEAELVFAGLEEELRQDDSFMTQFAELLHLYGKTELALRVVEELLPSATDDQLRHAGLLELAADIATTQGRHDRAAEYLERVLAVTSDVAMPLSTVRARYSTLVDLRRRSALIARDSTERDEAISQMLKAARQWRAEDPANPALDRLTAEALYALDMDEEGWRHISSIAERAPKEGQAWADVAAFLEGQGQRDRAAELWQQAADVEPTNPTWVMGLARNAEINGDKDQAKALADKVIEGDWQPRFSNVVQNANRMKERLE